MQRNAEPVYNRIGQERNDKPLQTAPIKLPVIKTLGEALTILIRERVAFGKAMLAPVLIGLATGYGVDLMPPETTLTDIAGSLATILDIVLWATFAVNCHRIALLGPDKGFTAFSLVIGRRQLNFAGYAFLFLWLVPMALFSVWAVTYGISATVVGPEIDGIIEGYEESLWTWFESVRGDPVKEWLLYLAVSSIVLLPFAFVLTLTGLMVPALSVDRDISLTTGLTRSKGNLGKIFLPVYLALAVQPVLIAVWFEFSAESAIVAFIEKGIILLLSYMGWAFTAGVLSNVYRNLIGLDGSTKQEDLTVYASQAELLDFYPRFVEATYLSDGSVLVNNSVRNRGYKIGRSRFDEYVATHRAYRESLSGKAAVDGPSDPDEKTGNGRSRSVHRRFRISPLHSLAAFGLFCIPIIFFLDEISAFIVKNFELFLWLLMLLMVLQIIRTYTEKKGRGFRRQISKILEGAPRQTLPNLWRRRVLYGLTTTTLGLFTFLFVAVVISLPNFLLFFLEPFVNEGFESVLSFFDGPSPFLDNWIVDAVARISAKLAFLVIVIIPPLGLLAHLLYRHRHGRGPTKEDVIALSGYRETAG